MNSPLKYYGSKKGLASKIVSMFPPHDTYVEVFAGGGAVLFAKQPSRIEFYNDADEGLYNFYDILRNRGEELIEKLDLTLYSRVEYQKAQEGYSKVTDALERARRHYILIQQSLNGRFMGAWSREFQSNRAETYFNGLKRLPETTARLQHVQIENKDFRVLLDDFDDQKVLLYLDPPYLAETRAEPDRYHLEMSDQDHKDLLDRITKTECMVVLSGYDNPLYSDALKGWVKYEFKRSNYCEVMAGSSRNPSRGERIEVVWLNRAAVAARAMPLPVYEMPMIDFS